MKNIYKKVWSFINKTRLRKALSLTLAVLILLTSIRFIFLKPKEVYADSTLGFDEGYGTTVTDKNNTLSGTITNAQWKSEEFCKVDKCLYFDGSGDFVNFGDDSDVNFTTGSFTITGWFRAPDVATTRMIVSKHSTSAGGGYKVYLDSNGYLNFAIDDDPTWDPDDFVATAPTAFDDNKWHHFAAVKNGTSSITIYVDAVQYETEASLLATGSLSNSNNFYIGIDRDGSSNTFSGFLDEIKVYAGTARSANQIKADLTGETQNRGVSASFGPDNSYLSGGLVGYWKMDESSWTKDSSNSVLDFSGNNNHGTPTCTGSCTISGVAGGKFGMSGSFDGMDDFVNASSASSLDNLPRGGSMTFSAWYKLDDGSDSANNSIISKEAGASTNGWFVRFNPGGGNNIEARFRSDSVDAYSSSTDAVFTDTTLWHNISVTYNDLTDRKIRIFVDGQEVTYSTQTAAVGTLNDDSSYNLSIGNLTSGFWYFDGSIDETRLYNRALSPSEIQKLYNWAPGPVAYYKFDENTGTSIKDSSSNNNNSTTTGGSPNFAPGKFGSAANMNSGYYQVPNSSTIGFQPAYTFSFWAYPTILSSDVVDKRANGVGWNVLINQDKWQFAVDYSVTDLSCVGPNLSSTRNAWQHISITWDGSGNCTGVKLYKNGVLTPWASTQNSSGNRESDVSRPLTVGGNTFTNMTGMLDDLKIYNYARNETQIIEDMNGGHPAPGSPVGSSYIKYNFDEGYGTTTNNGGFGGSSLNGTITSGAWSNSGKFGKALTFTASTNVTATITDPGYVNSISLWVYPTTSAASKTLVTATKLTTNASSQPVYGGCTGSALSLNVWTHILAVSNGSGSCAIYQNGLLTSSGTTGVTFGTSLAIGGTSFTGNIDEFNFYNTSLNLDQAKLLFNQSSMAALGSTSTDSSGVGSFSAENEYCPPRSSGTCIPPVGHWKMDENTGTTISESSTHNGASTSLGGNTSWRPGKLGSSLYFDGVNDKVIISEYSAIDLGATTDSYTVQAWFKTTKDFTTSGTILWKWIATASTFPYTLYVSTSETVCFEMWSGGGNTETACSTSTVNDGNWHHVVGVRSVASNSMYLYLDGRLVDTEVTDLITTTMANDEPLCIGNGGAGSCETTDFEGQIDDVRIYNYERSISEIAWDYNRGKPVAHWKMDETSWNGTSGEVKDSSGNGYTGTAAGGATTATGKFNNSGTFDGTDDYFSTSSTSVFDGSAAYSVSAWINPDTAGEASLGTFFTKEGVLNIYLSGTTIQACQDGNCLAAPVSTYSNTWTAGTWTHVSLVHDGSGTYTFYINGINNTDDSSGWDSNTAGVIVVGGENAGASSFNFDGKIDDVRVYNYPISSQQAKLIMNEGAATRFAPLTGTP